jgi:uncharacterized integral membrane protein
MNTPKLPRFPEWPIILLLLLAIVTGVICGYSELTRLSLTGNHL